MIWDVDPEIFRIGPIAVRWYSLAFVIGFFLSEKYTTKILINKHKFLPENAGKLLMYGLVGTFIGARLGHVIFYQPEYYLSNPFEIIQVWKGGLASHGGYAGILIAIYLYTKKYSQISFFGLMDIIAAPCLFVGALIRLGNLMNSEIIGHPSNVAWAFVFKRIDLIPRHPSQIYEALGYLSISIILYVLYKKFNESWSTGRVFGFGLFLSFLFRAFVETFKENQVSFENDMVLNMGQALSIPFVVIGIFLAFNLTTFFKKILKKS